MAGIHQLLKDQKGFMEVKTAKMAQVGAPYQQQLLAVSEQGHLYSGGVEQYLNLGSQYFGVFGSLSPKEYFKDKRIRRVAGSSALGLALSDDGTLFGFGTNERSTLGYYSKDKYLGPHAMDVRLVDGGGLRENETIVDIGVLKQVMYVLTSERLLYAGKCVGQCGSYDNRPVFTDDEEQDIGRFKEFQLPFEFG